MIKGINAKDILKFALFLPQNWMMIEYQIFKRFDKIRSFTTTKDGGFSTGAYHSLNLSPFTGDLYSNFEQNLEKLALELKLDKTKILVPYQTHGSEIAVIDEDFLNDTDKDKLNGYDAIITNLGNICIGVTTADCVPVFLYDSKRGVTGIAHAGWKGICAGIVKKTVLKMVETYNSNPMDIYAAIGPSISGEVYQVGDELIDIFREAGHRTDKIFIRRKEGLYFDLWQACKIQLTETGIDPDQIEISGHCTFSEEELFFSARRLGFNSGRMYSGMVM